MNPLDSVDIENLTLVKYPAPVLREPTGLVEVFDTRLQALAAKMFEIMYRTNGVGLAATQVGLPLRLFVANPTLEEQDERVYVNPQILSQEGSQDGEEGCLSLPGVACKIKRYNKVRIKAQDILGQEIEETGEGMLARIFQHEIDHLDGRLIVDRMSPTARISNRQAMKDLEAAWSK